jgi:hypothetical protein
VKHGSDKFVCEKILECGLDELDANEIHYISEYNTKFPNGYNLTNGGQGVNYLKGIRIVLDESKLVKPEVREKKSAKRSDETKKRMSEGLKEAKKGGDHRKKMSFLTQSQHSKQKFGRFKDVTVEESKIDQYLHVRKCHRTDTEYVVVIIKKAKTSFVGKTEKIEDIKERARTFIRELIVWQRDQIAGTPSEDVIPLTNGNVCEEHG